MNMGHNWSPGRTLDTPLLYRIFVCYYEHEQRGFNRENIQQRHTERGFDSERFSIHIVVLSGRSQQSDQR